MRLLFIIPCYNEEFRLPQQEFIGFCSNNQFADFLFVNDGSSDNTYGVLQSLSRLSIHMSFLNLENNKGKAEAIREGILSIDNTSQYDYVGYLDADLATPLSELKFFREELMCKRNTLMLMGSRWSRMGAKIIRKPHRHYVGRMFATVVSQMLNLKVYDTQCGAKLISSEIVKGLFHEPFITSWLFDVEIIFRLKKEVSEKSFNDKIIEYPLNQWEDVGGSKLKLLDFIEAPLELFKVWIKYK